MGLLPLTYRRPAYIDAESIMKGSQSSLESARSSGEKSAGSEDSLVAASLAAGVPPELSFDRIIRGATCPPCTLRDFMNYLVYVERSPENLQFFLWYRDYVQRFSEAKTADVALAPPWTKEMEEEADMRFQKEQAEKLRKEVKTPALAIFKGSDFEKAEDTQKVEFDSFSASPLDSAKSEVVSEYVDSYVTSYRSQANDAFVNAGIKVPFTIQPFRHEIDRVIATYIMDGAPRQLNLADREQKAVLMALAYTTHPSAFREAARMAESMLRRQAHPNFVRWSICNGNRARVVFARSLGVGLIVASTAVAIILTLSRLGRGYRAFAAIGWVLGISTLIAAWKGMCVVLHGLHHRHVRPWELFGDENGEDPLKQSFDSFGTTNSYEEEPWVLRYESRNIVRKIFDREVWIEEPALRQIQDTIFVQSLLGALVLSGILTVIFVCLPGGNLF
ncbi:hypothetical protein QBC47DRAFT_147831 [Echria macrotheca]|uniref:RGS domain-containing protein n=1 Tax=Echria macrotheca TaxID=438768 RepID=A0AAJ0BI15_9PEZI|nr:hypothetical protein QBC47DRAFT_147831 [Echria macrotheca]